MAVYNLRNWLEKLNRKVHRSPKVVASKINYRWRWRGGIDWPYLFVETDFMIKTKANTILIEVDNSTGASALSNVAKYTELLSAKPLEFPKLVLIHILGPKFRGETQRNFIVYMELCKTLAHKLNMKYIQWQISNDGWNEFEFNRQVYGLLKNKHLI